MNAALHIPRHRAPILPVSSLARILVAVVTFAPPVLFVLAMAGAAS